MLNKTMRAGNAVQLFVLVWTFIVVCQADDDVSVICEDVTGTVRNEVTLTCSVSLHRSECCIIVYRFQYPEKYKDSTICKQVLPRDPCVQRNRFTCSFTPTTVMTEQFRFFAQTLCGAITTEFTVNITEPIKPEIIEDPDFSVSCEDVTGAVRNEVTLTCSVSHLRSECCIIMYKFKYPEKYNESTICKQDLPRDSCDQRNRFTCSFTPTTVMTEQFRFFVQTQCGAITTEFTVNITEPIKPEIIEDLEKFSENGSRTSQQDTTKDSLTFTGCLQE